jgi:hypothetical protein
MNPRQLLLAIIMLVSSCGEMYPIAVPAMPAPPSHAGEMNP